MVQKGVAVAVLTLALGAWGCGDDSVDGAAGGSGTGGTGGTSATGGTGGGTMTTACNEEPDLSTATSPEFVTRFWICYDAADADVGPSVESCLQDAPGLSTGCAGCYGDYAECIDTDCGESCNDRGADIAPCSQCLLTGCNIALTSCTGVASPAVQPQL